MSFLHLFAHTKDFEEYVAGDVVFRAGDPGTKMYVVLEGRVGVEIHGKRVLEAGPGELVGEMALIDATSRSATTTALEPSKLAVVDEKRFLFLVQQTPFFALQVMRVLVSRLRSMDDQL